MKNKTFKVKRHINPKIKVGDKVQMVDGSAFTHKNKEGRFIIVKSYEHLTGDHKIIKDMIGTVTEIKQEYVTTGLDIVYLQDIVIKLGNTEFRTASKFVKKQPTFCIGQRFKTKKCFTDDEYILAQIDYSMVTLISLKGGNRNSKAIKVNNVGQITHDELLKIMNGDKFELISQ